MHDGRAAADMFATLGAGQTLLAGRAHDSDRLPDSLTEGGAFANIRLMPSRNKLPAFGADLYTKRNQAQMFFSCSVFAVNAVPGIEK